MQPGKSENTLATSRGRERKERRKSAQSTDSSRVARKKRNTERSEFGGPATEG